MTRLEAFSDAIFAIAATLLVLEIRVPGMAPNAPVSALWREMGALWPSYLAFVLSFGTILVMWVNHHNAIRMLCRTSKPFLYANGLLLLFVTFMPFPTALLARYIDTPFMAVATVCYAAYAVLTNGAFLVWGATMQSPVYLGRPELTREEIARLNRRTLAGSAAYVVIGIVSWWYPKVGLALLVVLWVCWVLLSIGPRSEA